MSPECGYNGGDCLEFLRKYPNCGKYMSPECGYDGGDCLRFFRNTQTVKLMFLFMLVMDGVMVPNMIYKNVVMMEITVTIGNLHVLKRISVETKISVLNRNKMK